MTPYDTKQKRWLKSLIYQTKSFRINLAKLAKFAIDYGLKNLIGDSVEFVRTFLQNVFTSAVW